MFYRLTFILIRIQIPKALSPYPAPKNEKKHVTPTFRNEVGCSTEI